MASAYEAFSDTEVGLIVAFAACSLDESPGSNWVQDAGGLPSYICVVAKAIKRSGKSTSSAIAIAVSRIKVWATGKGVDADTQAKAAKALAEWEKLKAKSKARDVKNTATADLSLNLTDGQLLTLIALTPPCHQTGLDKVLFSITPRNA